MIAIKYIKFNKFLIFTGIISIFFITLSTNIANNFLWRVNHLNVDLELINNHDYDSSVGKRYLWMISGINNIKNKPLLGHGVGSYYNKIESYISKNDINIDPLAIVSNNPHNEFISISSQIGLFGFLLFTMFFISLYKDSSKSFLTQGVFVTVLISSLFNSAFYDNILGIFLVVIIGVSYQSKKQI
jgi:O-antigen ligase